MKKTILITLITFEKDRCIIFRITVRGAANTNSPFSIARTEVGRSMLRYILSLFGRRREKVEPGGASCWGERQRDTVADYWLHTHVCTQACIPTHNHTYRYSLTRANTLRIKNINKDATSLDTRTPTGLGYICLL